MAGCSIKLLGGFSVRSADGRDLVLRTRKDKLLLAQLALSAGQPQSRTKLANLLWADRQEAQARDSLRQSLLSLRQAFRLEQLEPVCADRETVTLTTRVLDIDAIAFARLAADDATLSQAIKLYAGDVLDGFDGGGSPEFDTWLLRERDRFRDIAVHALERLSLLADLDIAIPDDMRLDGIRLGRHLLSQDILREQVVRAVMRLHQRLGERSEALKLYNDCRAALRSELGASPEAATAELYRDILTGRSSATVSPDIGESATSTTETKPTIRPSIAVLPFANIGSDPVLASLCEGMAEDTITGIGRFRHVFVIDRHSSVAVAQDTADIAEIGRRLGVVNLVQGSLQKLGETVRITVRLIDSATRAQIWGESYDAPLLDIMTLPDKITGAIISTLHGRLENSLVEQSRYKPTLAAYECLLRGVKHLRSYGPDDNRLAIELFQQAMELDPSYALARAYRGFSDVVVHGYEDAPAEVLTRSLEMATTAVAMEDDNGRCHWILGMVFGYLGNLRQEEVHYRRAIALNPNDANAIAVYGLLTCALDRVDEGLDLLRQAMRLNPYHPEWYWIVMGMILYKAQEYDAAAAAYAHRTQPGHWLLAHIAGCHAQSGRMEEAAAAAAEVMRLRPAFQVTHIRRAGWSKADHDHIHRGMRKAGLPG